MTGADERRPLIVSNSPLAIARSHASLRHLSLEQRFPLLISALLSVVFIAGLLLAYREIRNSAELATIERLRRVTRQLAELSGTATNARLTSMRAVAADSAVHRALRAPTSPLSAAARAALQRLVQPVDSGLPVELWSPEVQRVGGLGLEVGDNEAPAARERLEAATHADSGRLGRLFRAGGGIYLWSTVPVRDNGRLIGFVAQKRRVGGNPRAEQQIRELTGGDATTYYRNSSGDVWTNLVGVPVPAPTRVDSAQGVVSYIRPGQGRVLAMSAGVPNAPIEIVIETPEHQMLARPRAIMRRLGLIAAVLTMAGAAAAWVLSRRLTRPLVQLTTAAEAISQGNYDGSVDVSRRDEIGRLAATFNRMTEQVRESHGALERHYDEARLIAEELERANARLVTAVAEAQAANRAKSAFLATMSHEIRTPINAMLGYTELIGMGISGPITEEQRKQLERVRMSGQHLVGLVNEVLDFARIESSQLTVETAVGASEEAVDASLALVRPQADAKGIRLSSIEEGPARYVGDPQRVRQILVNLLTNAVKFTPTGGRVRVEYGVETAPSNPGANADLPTESQVFFRVRDTGIGIAPEELELIFEPFTQADSGYTRRQGGSGLGLSISRSLAHLMDGNVTVESKVDAGSCFTLVLPAAAASVVSPVEGAATILR